MIVVLVCLGGILLLVIRARYVRCRRGEPAPTLEVVLAAGDEAVAVPIAEAQGAVAQGVPVFAGQGSCTGSLTAAVTSVVMERSLARMGSVSASAVADGPTRAVPVDGVQLATSPMASPARARALMNAAAAESSWSFAVPRASDEEPPGSRKTNCV